MRRKVYRSKKAEESMKNIRLFVLTIVIMVVAVIAVGCL